MHLLAMQNGGRRVLTADQGSQIEVGDRALFDDPPSRHHDPVGPMRARENQGRERIKGSGEAQLVESEQDKIRRRSRGDRAELRTPETGCRPGGRLAQRIARRYPRHPVAAALQQKGAPDFLHQV